MKRAKKLLYSAAITAFLSIIPSTAFADTVHIVQNGDSLWKISAAYGVTVDEIQRLNSLSSTLIHPGQTLVVKKDNSTGSSAERVRAVDVSRGEDRAKALIAYAKSFEGVPYRSGGQSPAGFDCSGFVKYVFKNSGIELPRTAAGQYNFGTKISAQEAQPGDIVAFKDGGHISHTGIYIGNNQFISSTSSRGVLVTSIYGPYWGEHLYGFSRVIP